MFETVERGPRDLMFELKKRADNDLSPEKVDLGVGIYRNELGRYHELGCIKKAKKTLDLINPGHDYELTTGDSTFLGHAARLLFGEDCPPFILKQITSVQTISGTGANHLGALFLSKCYEQVSPQVHIGTPTWGNYEPLFRLVGFDFVPYNYYNSSRKCVDFAACIDAVKKAPRKSVFVLQGCCHNPTGADLDREQWRILAEEMKLAGHVPFFDVAYQGLGDGLEQDAFGVQLFAGMGFEMVVCQSFSKNFGLYSERVGALHIVNKNEEIAANVHDQLRSLIRWEFSSAPAYGSRLVNIVLGDKEDARDWLQELGQIRERLQTKRSRLFGLLTHTFETPGDWSHIMREKGLFCYLGLNPTQCCKLVDRFHIYLPTNGRINIAGLNDSCIERVASAIDTVVREMICGGLDSG